MKNIIIRNLNSETTPEAIRSLFEPFGTVRKVKLMTHKDTGVSRRFAFLEMTEAKAGQAIAPLDGRIVDGRDQAARGTAEGAPRLIAGACGLTTIGASLIARAGVHRVGRVDGHTQKCPLKITEIDLLQRYR
jgi:cold-inducible RNA-binding protein